MCLLSVLELPTETFYWGTTSPLCCKLVYKPSQRLQTRLRLVLDLFRVHFDLKAFLFGGSISEVSKKFGIRIILKQLRPNSDISIWQILSIPIIFVFSFCFQNRITFDSYLVKFPNQNIIRTLLMFGNRKE